MMSTCRHAPAMVSVIVVALVATASVGRAQEPTPATAAEEQEIISLATIVGAALKGQIVPTDEPFLWTNDFIKSSQQTTFVPFTLAVPQSKVNTPTVAMYIYVTPQGAPTATAADTLPEAVFEDAYHVSLGAPSSDGNYEIRRGFSAPSGDYDVYVALSESAAPDGTEAKTMMLKQAVSVPNLWSNELATSSVILASRIEALTAPLPPDQALANPYTLGTMRIVPKLTGQYLTSDELSLLLIVYNAGTATTGLPDVNVEYSFSTRLPAGDEFFNKTAPQVFNDSTLPPEFSLTEGWQLVAGQDIPLSAFAAADYRLEITVTDNTNGRTLIRNVDFSVSES